MDLFEAAEWIRLGPPLKTRFRTYNGLRLAWLHRGFVMELNHEHALVTAWHDGVLRWHRFCALRAHIAKADERPRPRLV